jgi:FkbM family methyltransferase
MIGKELLKAAYSTLPFKQSIFEAMRGVGIIPPQRLQDKLRFEGILHAQMDDVQFRMHKGSRGEVLESRIFWQGLGNGWERYSLRIWAVLCRCHDVILDVGANTGVYSLLASAVNPDARIFAFEPIPRIFDRLRSNVELNRFNLSLEPIAASNYDGSASMWEPTGFDVSYCGAVNSNLYQDQEVPAHELVIRTNRLDTFAHSRGLSGLGLVKIDVEGHEPEVIEGMGDFINQRPTLLFEVWNAEVSSRDIGSLLETHLKGKGYLFFVTDEESPFRQTENIRSSDRIKKYTNHVACTEAIAKQAGLLKG